MVILLRKRIYRRNWSKCVAKREKRREKKR